MREPSRDDSIDDLLVQVEQLWREQADKESVVDLISRHPEFAEEMQEFFTDLVESDDPVDAELQRAEESVHQWLLTRGIDQALAATAQLRQQVTSTTTRRVSTDCRPEATEAGPVHGQQVGQALRDPWLAFLGERLNRKKTELAMSLPNVTLEFLSLVSRYPSMVPEQVKNALSRSVQEHLGVPAKESLERLSGPDVVLKRAASRREPSGGPPKSFEQLLERAALPPAANAFWRECARKGD